MIRDHRWQSSFQTIAPNTSIILIISQCHGFFIIIVIIILKVFEGTAVLPFPADSSGFTQIWVRIKPRQGFFFPPFLRIRQD